MRAHEKDAGQVGRRAPGPSRAGQAVGLNSHWLKHLQRLASAGGGASAGPAPDKTVDHAQVQRAAVDEALRSPSHPLEPSLQQEMETRYDGADFSAVQVHDGTVARKAAVLIDAKAFAAGGHIVDGGAMSKKDWAHELAHTMDPEPALGTDNGAGLAISHPRDRGERFAETASDRAMAEPAPVQRGSRPLPGDRHRHGPGCTSHEQPMSGPTSVQRVATGRSPAREPHVATVVQRAPGEGTATEERPGEQETVESARGESLQLRDHENTELYSGDHDRLVGYVRHLAATDRSDIYRLLLNRLSGRGFAAQADIVQQVWGGADKPRSARRVPVPRDLHFIWLGGKPGDAVVANLNAWKENAEDSNWTLTLWTDASSSRVKALEKIFGNRLKIRADSDKLVKENAGEENYRIYKDAKRKSAHNLASDILRYTVMKKYGGVYMDVDVAPGTVQLRSAPEVLMHSEEVPLLAPRLRDKNSVHTALGREETDQDPTPEDLSEAATARYGKGVLGNNFILAPGSEFMEEILRNLPQHFTDLKEKYGSKNIEGDLAGLASDISGPGYMEKFLKQYTGQHQGVMEQDHSTAKAPDMAIKADEFQHLFPPEALEFWKALGWVTPESENQLDGGPGMSRTQSLLRTLRGKK
ncbi:TcdA/TcdB catalytic glycosyltransferase domain-containing protein [Streptomyces sp. NPDC059355]|uniref:TcdA/TcdB catalytic glycosyltransferase domain-containing protein n=1 Tax=Streptomyces sp. NPDC059355 TaxID=3346811 RepID=UPI0036AA5E36